VTTLQPSAQPACRRELLLATIPARPSSNFVASNKVRPWALGKTVASNSLLAVVFILGLHSANAASSSKASPLEKAIERAVSQGIDKIIDSPLADNMGFPGPVQSKALMFKKDRTPDGQEHGLLVVLRDGKPEALVWSRAKVTEDEIGRSVEGRSFRTNLRGKLKSAIGVAGRVGEVVQNKLPTRSKEVRAEFEKERDYYLSLCESLP
jgi:hypothetical protein